MATSKRLRAMAAGCAAVCVATLIACGGREPPPTARAAEPPAAGTSDQQPVVAHAGGFWADVPVYPGATVVEQVTSEVPKSRQMGEYRTLHFRYFETGAEVGAVADFYLQQMPNHGWTKVMAMDFNRPHSAMSSWVKRDGDVAANVSVGRDGRGGATYITMMRGEGVAE